MFAKINDEELSLAIVNSFLASSESSKIAGSSFMRLIFLGCLGLYLPVCLPHGHSQVRVVAAGEGQGSTQLILGSK